jgi:hypothetical protein
MCYKPARFDAGGVCAKEKSARRISKTENSIWTYDEFAQTQEDECQRRIIFGY